MVYVYAYVHIRNTVSRSLVSSQRLLLIQYFLLRCSFVRSSFILRSELDHPP